MTTCTSRSILATLTSLLLLAGACTSGESESSNELGNGNPDPCADILLHGCDGLTGDKLAGCKADIENAYAECVTYTACQTPYELALKECGKDIACIDAATKVFEQCLGPAPSNPPPGK